MGSAASVELPEMMDEAACRVYAGESFSSEIFETHKNEAGLVSREVLLELAQRGIITFLSPRCMCFLFFFCCVWLWVFSYIYICIYYFDDFQVAIQVSSLDVLMSSKL